MMTIFANIMHIRICYKVIDNRKCREIFEDFGVRKCTEIWQFWSNFGLKRSFSGCSIVLQWALFGYVWCIPKTVIDFGCTCI